MGGGPSKVLSQIIEEICSDITEVSNLTANDEKALSSFYAACCAQTTSKARPDGILYRLNAACVQKDTDTLFEILNEAIALGYDVIAMRCLAEFKNYPSCNGDERFSLALHTAARNARCPSVITPLITQFNANIEYRSSNNVSVLHAFISHFPRDIIPTPYQAGWFASTLVKRSDKLLVETLTLLLTHQPHLNVSGQAAFAKQETFLFADLLNLYAIEKAAAATSNYFSMIIQTIKTMIPPDTLHMAWSKQINNFKRDIIESRITVNPQLVCLSSSEFFTGSEEDPASKREALIEGFALLLEEIPELASSTARQLSLGGTIVAAGEHNKPSGKGPAAPRHNASPTFGVF